MTDKIAIACPECGAGPGVQCIRKDGRVRIHVHRARLPEEERSDRPPDIEDAPGLTWALRKTGWEARWRPRRDLVKRGYQTKSVPLYLGWEPDETRVSYVQSMCRRLQAEMLEWSNGGNLLKFVAAFDGTWGSLIDCYRSDKDSPYHGLRYHTRLNHDNVYDRLKRDRGTVTLAETTARTFLAWHREAKGEGNHVAAAHSLMTRIRTVVRFGATFFERGNETECKRLREILHDQRFEGVGHRTEQITVDQADAVRRVAHATGRHSVALAQAFAFECTLRQKDVIGEYVPLSEPGPYDKKDQVGNDRWDRGLRWREIDENFILVHMTSKKQKLIECNLRLAPMVMEELAFYARIDPAKAFTDLKRSDLPKDGPIIIYEVRGVPYDGYQFRKQWRTVATKAGVPKEVWNMDSRSGAITEATDAGADLEHVKHAAAHSNISQTQQYSRGAAKKTAEVMRIRVASRNKAGTNAPETQRDQDDARMTHGSRPDLTKSTA